MKKAFLICALLTGGAAVFAQTAETETDDPDPAAYFNPAPSKVGEKFTIFFAANTDYFWTENGANLPAKIAEWNQSMMKSLLEFLNQHTEFKIFVKGRTNGGTKNNLSEKRAREAIKILSFFGIPKNRVYNPERPRYTEGSDPVASINKGNEWMNRRVDFEIVLDE